jgi:uncharacterized RDD family membrane protein YckC
MQYSYLSPEKTVLTVRLARIQTRFGAHLIDLLVLMLINSALSQLLVLPSTVAPAATIALQTFLFSAALFLYFILMEGLWGGMTLGKRLFRIRVVMADGTPITFKAAVVRNLLRPADFLPALYVTGLISTFVNPRAQRLGDLAAETMVAIEERAVVGFSVAPHRVGIHPLEANVGELRNMSDDQYYVLRSYCDRFPALPEYAQKDLTDSVWIPISKKLDVKFPPNVHPIYIAEAVVMKYGRIRGLL